MTSLEKAIKKIDCIKNKGRKNTQEYYKAFANYYAILSKVEKEYSVYYEQREIFYLNMATKKSKQELFIDDLIKYTKDHKYYKELGGTHTCINYANLHHIDIPAIKIPTEPNDKPQVTIKIYGSV